MKKFVGILIIGLVFSVPVFAGETKGPHVHVIGSATEEIIPDKMLWYLIVLNKDFDLLKAATDHRTSVNSVLALLKKVDIPEEKIQTTRMSYGENLVYRNGQNVKEGYIASTSVTFTLKNFSNYNQLWIDLSRISGVSIKGVSYDSSKRTEIEASVRSKALLNAKEKAAVMAKTLSAQLGEVIMIEDMSYPALQGVGGYRQYQAYYLSTSYDMGDSAQQVSAPIALGKIPVAKNIKVEFRLETKK